MWVTLWVSFALAAVAGCALVLGARRWQRATDALCSRLEAASAITKPGRYIARQELDRLPALVQRYFREVLRDDQPIVAAMRVDHTGYFNMSENGERWRPFVSTQRVTARRPGFVWNARIALLPGVSLRMHDAYVEGEGMLRASLAGLVTLAELQGTPEIARGELMRFLAEAVWYPTALLPSQGVDWTPVGETLAKATLHDGNVAVTLLVHFDEDGLIASMRAEARGRTVKGAVVSTPWEARCWNYAPRGGMLVPLEGEAAWLLPEGAKPYWRGRMANLTYKYAEPTRQG
jgi:hypothetical protein